MDAPRPVTALALALALAGCGESKEEQRVKQLKAICESAVGATIVDLENTYTIPIRIAQCDGTGEVSTLGCTLERPLCDMGFVFQASTDPAVCEPEGCYFTCTVRAQQADLKAHEDDRAATICGTKWIDGQPQPPYRNALYWVPGLLP